MENCDQGLSEYFRVLLQWLSNHLSLHRFFLFDLIIFHVLFFCINKISIFMGVLHTVNMVRGVIKLDWFHFWTRARKFCLRRACFWIYLCFYWIPLDVIHVCGCYGGVVLCVTFHIFKMVLWRGNYIGFHHVSLTVLLHLCCWVHIQDSFYRYGIEDALDPWKYLGWYYWLGFLYWCCWSVFMCWYCCLVFLCCYCWMAYFLVRCHLFGPF